MPLLIGGPLAAFIVNKLEQKKCKLSAKKSFASIASPSGSQSPLKSTHHLLFQQCVITLVQHGVCLIIFGTFSSVCA